MAKDNFLARIIERKRERLARAKARCPLEKVMREASAAQDIDGRRSLSSALSNRGVNVIAEFKRASPSKGELCRDASPSKIAIAYTRGGAAAISVLTEEDFFRGSLRDLKEVRACTRLPLLRKDFVFDEYQLFESAAAGADAVLLIVAALGDRELAGLIEVAERGIGMDALVEVHTAKEMERAASAGARLIGVNNRNLDTFEVSLDTSIKLAALAPAGAILVSESGLRDAGDIERLRAHGYSAFLIGETLMRARSPQAALRALTTTPAS